VNLSLTHSARNIFATHPGTRETAEGSRAARAVGPWMLTAVAAGLALLAAAHGAPVTNDQEADWLSRLAQSGDAGAQTQLGLAYREGRYGLPVDVDTAVHWLEAGAYGGNSYAAMALGDAYAQGEGIAANRTLAEQWWQEAATAGDVRAQRELGQALVADGKPEQARIWLGLAADRGDAQSQATLRELTRAGLASVDDARRGENRLAASARRLDSPSLGLVAAAWDDLGLEAPAGERISRLEAEAHAGDPVAQYELGERYADGAWGVARDDAKAMHWLQASAEAGNGVAMKTLANVYSRGELGVSPDPMRAAQWQQRAEHAASPL
jgi:TPR repeat protein